MGRFLPAKHNDLHNICFYLHDIMASVVVEGESQKLFDTRIDFKTKEDGLVFQKQPNYNAIDWLGANGYFDEMKEIVIKQVIIATLSDFCHYVFEALKCSEKGKLSVAYTLLRKPFKDNLTILEWILADRDDFIQCFQMSSEYFDISGRNFSEKKKEFIKKVIPKISIPKAFNTDFIYEIRYSKKSRYGLEQLWNKANHIVTTCSHYKTENMNLNFIFSGQSANEEQWRYLYTVLPYLLFYTVEVVDVLLDREVGIDCFEAVVKTRSERIDAFIDMALELSRKNKGLTPRDIVKKYYSKLNSETKKSLEYR